MQAFRPALCSYAGVISNRPRRLAGVSYVGHQRYFLTICVAYRRPVFTSTSLATSVIEQLLRTARKLELSVPAYCVMPDHVHALVESQAMSTDFQKFVKLFKQTTGYAYRRQCGHFLWQPGYHERILRDDQATDAIVRYVLENPIRAGLTATLGDYPFAGSGEYSLDELRAAWETQA